MHELGIVIEIVKTVEDFVEKNHLSKVDTIILQIGKMAPVVPQYIETLPGKEFLIKEIIAY